MNQQICGAKTRAGTPCKKYGMPNGRCRLHGGLSLKGIESGTFKHGRHSKYMPTELSSIYQDASQDPDLLSLRAEIALVDVMISQLLPKLDTPEGGQVRQEIRASIDARRKLIESEHKLSMQGERAIGVEELMVLMSQVLNVIQTVVTDDKQRYAIATELQKLIR